MVYVKLVGGAQGDTPTTGIVYMYVYVYTYLVEAMLQVDPDMRHKAAWKPLGLILVDLVYLQPNLQLVNYIFMELNPIINKMWTR